MDWLLVFVIVAVVGQLCLPLVGRWRTHRAHQRAKARARLLEAAADRQMVSLTSPGDKVEATKETSHV
jgi:hypothetical protein